MKAVWVALFVGFFLAMVFLVFSATGTASPLAVMTGTPGIATMPAATAVETIPIHMYAGKVPVVY
jgi:hypothetical protein